MFYEKINKISLQKATKLCKRRKEKTIGRKGGLRYNSAVCKHRLQIYGKGNQRIEETGGSNR